MLRESDWCSGQHSGMGTEDPGFESLISADHFPIFDITAEKTTQFAAILSSDGTYNVNMHLRL